VVLRPTLMWALLLEAVPDWCGRRGLTVAALTAAAAALVATERARAPGGTRRSPQPDGWHSTPNLRLVLPPCPPGRRLRGETSRPCREARPDGRDMSASKLAS
jgi:hypothetical protein